MDIDRAPAGFDPEDIAPPAMRDREWPINSLALDLSGRCNLACRYCAESATQPKHRRRMTETVLDAALDQLAGEPDVNQFKSIRLGSGEPLLAGSLLRRLDRRLKQLATEGRAVPQVFITTNGTRLDRETREWLIGTGWQVKISLDGPAHVQDRWRVTAKGGPTYAQVAEVVAELARRIPDRFSVTAVLCRGNEPKEVFDAIAALGVRRIEMVPVAHHRQEILPDQADRARYRDFVLAYAGDYASGPNGQPELVRVINAARRVMGYDVKSVTCGAGRNFLGVGPEGDLFPCFRFVGLDQFVVGDVQRGPSARALRAFRSKAGRSYEYRERCHGCWAAPLCGGPCFAEAELFGPGAGAPFDGHCHYVKADSMAAVTLVEKLRKTDPERLLDLLAGLVEF